MNIVFVLIPLALGLLGLAVGAFFWAVRHRQFDDLETRGTMVLLDDDPVSPPFPRQEKSPGGESPGGHAS